jgi:hypothetical protein
MPRLSLYKPEKGNDYKFIDRQASEMFQVGGTDVYLHKYMGPELNANGTQDQPTIDSYNVSNIQDLLFLENRDRKYDSEIYKIRGLYNVQNIDFNLSQFGLFIDNDTLFMTVHINDFIKYIGRKPIGGDVLELPHLRDDFALNDFDISLPRYYVIEDVGRASEGFSVTWFPHLYRLKLKKITDSQQFADILNKPAVNADGMPSDMTLKDLLSTYNKEIAINNQVVAQAESDAPKSGYETRQFYTLAVDELGKPILNTADEATLLASNESNVNSSAVAAVPKRSGYTGYLLGDGFPVNGYDFGFGIQFPSEPLADDFFLRTDFFPNRLFRFDGKQSAWIAVEDGVRMNMTNNDSRQTLKTGFINNNDYVYNDALISSFKTYSQVEIDVGVSIINTTMEYAGNNLAKYIVFKQLTTQLSYVTADNVGIITNNNGMIRITLPAPDKLPYPGQWNIMLCNHRESEKQSLSKVLKPRADL